MPVFAAIGAFDIIVGALVAGILGFSLAALFRPLLSAALGSIPYAGPWIAQHVEELLAQAWGAAAIGVDAAIGPLGDLLRGLLAVTDTLTRYLVGTLDNVFNRLWRLTNADLPALEQRAFQRAEQLAQIAIQRADQDAQAAIQRADQEFQIAIQHTDQAAEAAIQRADQDATQAIAYAGTLAAAAIAHADQVGLALEQELGAQEQAQVAYTDQVAGAVLEYVQGVAHGLGLEVEQVGTQAEDYARALERQAVDHADAVGAAVATATAAATAAVAARVQDIEDSPCMRSCGVLGDLGSLLQGLEDAGLMALLAALVDEVREDPHAVQQVLHDDVTPLLRAAAAGLGLVGG